MKAAIYSRKSKFTEKGESVENQITLCEEYGKSIGITDFVTYEDEGFSGGNTSRPQFQKMMKDMQEKKFNYLICYRLDRISRNVSDFAITIEKLKKYNVEFISIREQFDTSSPMGRAMMNIAAVFAQLERETIAERIKDNMYELSKTGRWLGGTTPIGFKSEAENYTDSNGKDKKMYKLLEVPNEIETVKLIYNIYLEKKSFSSVANYLCKNFYKGKNGGEFSRQTVQQIITNPVYCIADVSAINYFKNLGASVYGEPSSKGFMVYNKREGGKKDRLISDWIFSIGEHPGIISSDLWIKCQQINESNKSKASPRTGTGNKFLLASMITCGHCSSGMASWSHFNKKRDFMERYYRCNLRTRASNRCNNKMLNAYEAEEKVIENIKNIDIELLIKNYHKTKIELDTIDSSSKEIEALNLEINKNNKTIQGLIRKIALLEDDIEIMEMFKNEIDIIKNENLQLENRIKEIGASIEKINDKKLSIDEIVDRINIFKKFIDYVEDINDKRELILSVVESIVWHSETEQLEINIIGSGKILPRGAVLARNLSYGSISRRNHYNNTNNIVTNTLVFNLRKRAKGN